MLHTHTAALLASLFLLPLLLMAQASESYSRLRIDLQHRDIRELAALGIAVDHGLYTPGRSYINDFSAAERRQLDLAAWEYQVEIADLESYYADANRAAIAGRGPDMCGDAGSAYEVPVNFNLGSMGGFFTYEEMWEELLDMQALYPHLIHGPDSVAGIRSIEDRPILWLRISDNPEQDEADEPEVLYTALHHAREPGSLTQMIFYMWYLLENYETDEQIKFLVDQSELYFMPCINPDGYVYNQVNNPEGGGLWRKNRRMNEDGTYGVDLNRNYGYKWGFDNFGSSPSPGSQTYRGTAGFSEPETQAVREFCNAHEFRVTLNYHTHGNLLIYPWGYSNESTPDSTAFKALGAHLSSQNDYLVGTGLETVGYTVNGDSDDWMYGEMEEKPAILSLTPEVGEGGFWPTIDQIIPQSQATVFMNLAAAAALHYDVGVFRLDDGVSYIPEDEIRFKIQHTGLQAGDVNISLTAMSGNQVTISAATQQLSLDNFAEETISFPVAFFNDPQAGDRYEFLLTIDNGNYLTYDTIPHLYFGTPNPAFFDDFVSLNNWENAFGDSWALTDEDFTSESTSLTDSPFSIYPNNDLRTMRTKHLMTVPEDFQSGLLMFQAKWDIEAGYDYAQLYLLVNDHSVAIPLCGQYSRAGSDNQQLGLPVWDGTQSEWVQERIDISEYIAAGDSIGFQFLFASDGFVQGDGFYVDDFGVFFFGADPTPTREQLLAEDAIRLYPQPTTDIVHLEFKEEQAGPLTYHIVHPSGAVVQQGQLSSFDGRSAQVQTNRLADGFYLLRLQTGNQTISVLRLVKM